MEKDYQEALDILADRELDDVGKMSCRDLQELINDYDNLCKVLYAKQIVIEKHEELENDYKKALDKATEIIVKEVGHCPKGRDCLYDDWIVERDCKRCWKEWLSKDE